MEAGDGRQDEPGPLRGVAPGWGDHPMPFAGSSPWRPSGRVATDSSVVAGGFATVLVLALIGCAASPLPDGSRSGPHETGAAARTTPEPPRSFIDTSPSPPSGRTIEVRSGGDLQAALDRAAPGDVIALEPGAVYTGPFTLPVRQGTGWTTIRGVDERTASIRGQRVQPREAARMARLQASGDSVITAAPGAHHYRLVGLEMSPSPGSFLYNVVLLGSNENDVARMPHHIIIERCFIHGDPRKGSRRGVALNGAHLAVIDSWLSDFKEVGADTQAIAGWNGPGPFRITGNFLEAAGENVMFGGADPVVTNLVPSDIEIRRNHVAKPLSWRSGTQWSVKNLLELKNARRVLIEGNLFERNWPAAQKGFAILFTVRNQDGAAPWSVIEDVVFENNIVTQVAAGINILGRDDSARSGQARRIAIRNNLFSEVGGGTLGGSGILFQILNGTADLAIEGNTASHTGAVVMAEGEPHTRFVYRANRTRQGTSGIMGTGTGAGAHTLRTYFPRAIVEDNGASGRGAALRALCAALAPADRPRDHCGASVARAEGSAGTGP